MRVFRRLPTIFTHKNCTRPNISLERRHQYTYETIRLYPTGPPYIPHIGDAIWREFPRLVWRPIRLVRDAEQVEQLTLQLGELRVEDLDGAAVAHEHVPLGEAE